MFGKYTYAQTCRFHAQKYCCIKVYLKIAELAFLKKKGENSKVLGW